MAVAALTLLLLGCTTTTGTQKETDQDRLANLNVQLGVGYMNEGNLEVALLRLEKALELDPGSADAHNAMAVLRERLGQDEAAERHYREAVRLGPDLSPAHSNFGRFLCRTGRAAEGEQQFRAAVDNPLYSTPEIPLTNAGICARADGRLDAAEDYLLQALQSRPRYAPALLTMAEVQLERGRGPQAQGYLQRYEAAAPKNPDSLWLGFRIQRLIGDEKAASRYALDLEGRYPDSPQTQQLRAGLR